MDFLRLPYSISEGFFGGQAGGGKSWTLLTYPLFHGWHQNPNFRGLLMRRTYPELEASHISESKKIFPLFGATYDGTNHVWHFPSGAEMRFSYAKRKQDVEQYDTSQFSYIALDELTHFLEYQYLYMLSRNRTSDKSLPAIMRTGSNPLNIGHAWVKARFITPFPKGRRRIQVMYPDGRYNERIFIPSALRDNPSMMENDPNYEVRLRELPEAERKAKLEGDWDAVAGAVFPEFREQHYETEPDNAVHVIDPFEIPNWWPKIVALDWGYAALTYALFLAVSPDKRVYAFREYGARKKSINTWAAEVGQIASALENVVAYVIDPSSTKNLGYEMTIKQQAEVVMGVDFELADNDRLSGKQLIHDYLRWIPRPPRYVPPQGYSEDTAYRILRLRGTAGYHEYVQSFTPDPPEGIIPRLQIFNNCELLIETIPMCVYADDKKDGQVKAEDVKEFDGDDPYDTLRYGLKKVDAYVKEAVELGDFNAKRQAILDRYAGGGGYPAFDREMGLLERKQSESRRAVHTKPRVKRLRHRLGGGVRPSLERPGYGYWYTNPGGF